MYTFLSPGLTKNLAKKSIVIMIKGKKITTTFINSPSVSKAMEEDDLQGEAD